MTVRQIEGYETTNLSGSQGQQRGFKKDSRKDGASGLFTFTQDKVDPDNVKLLGIAASQTLNASHVGVALNVVADALTLTLPATVVGMSYKVYNGGADGEIAVTISPDANDKIIGALQGGTDDKDVVNTKATAKHGDYIKIIADGSLGWYVTEMVGTWAFES